MSYSCSNELAQEIAMEREEDLLIMEEFEEALIGVAANAFVYDVEKCIEILVRDNDMTEEEAVDYFDYNTRCAYVGEHTPILVDNMSMFKSCKNSSKKV